MLHIKGDDTKLKYSQFKKMSLKYFVQLYFWIPLPLFLVLLFTIIVLLWHFFKHCSQSCSFLKNPSKQDRILTVYTGRKEIDGISLSSPFHKWTKWNNRLVMFWVVWCGGAKKYFKQNYNCQVDGSWLACFFQLWKNILISILYQED